jgi:acetoin utilization protein AcuC
MKNRSIYELNHLSPPERTKIYRSLIPPSLFAALGIDRNTFLNRRGEKVVQFHTPESHGFVSVDVKKAAEDQDSVFFLQLSDTPFMDNLELSFVVINDPKGERYNIDRDTQGRDTLFGTTLRNLAEEEKAMKAGLAPGQVRPGLRLLGEMLRLLERFASRLGTSIISCEALFYHNAIKYERYGFGYLEGRKMMEEIDQGFSPGGSLYEKLDHSSPFRRKDAEKTVRGRSWAIQDGILGKPWSSPRLYKPIGKVVGLSTFHGQGY